MQNYKYGILDVTLLSDDNTAFILVIAFLSFISGQFLLIIFIVLWQNKLQLYCYFFCPATMKIKSL